MNLYGLVGATWKASYNSEGAIIAGNAALYGATAGKAAVQHAVMESFGTVVFVVTNQFCRVCARVRMLSSQLPGFCGFKKRNKGSAGSPENPHRVSHCMALTTRPSSVESQQSASQCATPAPLQSVKVWVTTAAST